MPRAVVDVDEEGSQRPRAVYRISRGNWRSTGSGRFRA